MKLTALECPKCNATLEIAPESTYVTCTYCGCRFLIDSESEKAKPDSEDIYKMGYAFEHGRYERQSKECRNLANKVKALSGAITDLRIKKGTLELLLIEISNLETDQKRLASISGKVKSYKVPIYSLIVTGVLSAIGAGVGIFVLGVIASVILFYIMRFRRNKEQDAVSKLIQQKTEELAQIKNEVLSITKTYDFDLIPEKYRSKNAIEYIYEVLYNQRAMNISQAINLYEDDQYKKRMERLQREQIELQRTQQAQNAEKSMERPSESSLGLGSLLKAGGLILAAAAFIKKLDDD